MVMLWVF